MMPLLLSAAFAQTLGPPTLYDALYEVGAAECGEAEGVLLVKASGKIKIDAMTGDARCLKRAVKAVRTWNTPGTYVWPQPVPSPMISAIGSAPPGGFLDLSLSGGVGGLESLAPEELDILDPVALGPLPVASLLAVVTDGKGGLLQCFGVDGAPGSWRLRIKVGADGGPVSASLEGAHRMRPASRAGGCRWGSRRPRASRPAW